MVWHGRIANEAERRGVFPCNPGIMAGGTIGVVAMRFNYPKLPGNVVNPSTYSFPVIYEQVDFEVERLFAGDPTLKDEIIAAARALEARGAAAIVGACGFFAHFQEEVADAVDVPVFMSSLVQLHSIKMGLRRDQKVLVLAADGASITEEMLNHVGTTGDRVVVQNLGDRDSFAPIRWGERPLDNGALIDDLCELVRARVSEDPSIKAVMLECSDLPPYAADIQAACGLPVFDFISLINWVHQSICQPVYYGLL